MIAQVLILRPTHPQVTFRTHFGTRSGESSGSLILTCPQQGVVAPFGGREDKGGFSRCITAEHLITHHLALITTFLELPGTLVGAFGLRRKILPLARIRTQTRTLDFQTFGGDPDFTPSLAQDLDLPFTRKGSLLNILNADVEHRLLRRLDHAMIPDDVGKVSLP